MVAHPGNGKNQSRNAPHPKSETAGVARRGVKTPGNICALGSAMLADVANCRIDHKEVVSYSRGAGVMLAGARVGQMVGFAKDLVDAESEIIDEELLREEAELTARLEAIREKRAAGCA